MPFVPVSIISLFGLADFQLEAALLGAPAAGGIAGDMRLGHVLGSL